MTRAWIWAEVEDVRSRFAVAGLERVLDTDVVIDPNVDRWDEGERTVADCEVDGSIIRLSPRLESFDHNRRSALIAHEFGHAAQALYRTKIHRRDEHDSVEREADRIAERAMGRLLYYAPIAGRLIQTFDSRNGVRPRPRGLM